MADNKTVPTRASVTAFLATLSDPAQRADAKALIKLMREASGEKPVLWGPSIIGFGSRHYRYDSGREGDTLLIGFSPRKAATVIYGTAGAKNAPALLARLGKHKTGKGCLYIKRLSEVDAAVLRELIIGALAAAKQRPG